MTSADSYTSSDIIFEFQETKIVNKAKFRL